MRRQATSSDLAERQRLFAEVAAYLRRGAARDVLRRAEGDAGGQQPGRATSARSRRCRSCSGARTHWPCRRHRDSRAVRPAPALRRKTDRAPRLPAIPDPPRRIRRRPGSVRVVGRRSSWRAWRLRTTPSGPILPSSPPSGERLGFDAPACRAVRGTGCAQPSARFRESRCGSGGRSSTLMRERRRKHGAPRLLGARCLQPRSASRSASSPAAATDGIRGRSARGASLVLLSVPPLITSLVLLLLAARTGWLPAGGLPHVPAERRLARAPAWDRRSGISAAVAGAGAADRGLPRAAAVAVDARSAGRSVHSCRARARSAAAPRRSGGTRSACRSSPCWRSTASRSAAC